MRLEASTKINALNILYICTPWGLHDQKWISFFSGMDNIRQFIVWENQHDGRIDTPTRQFLTDSRITCLPSYRTFSLYNFPQTLRAVRLLNRYVREHRIDLVHILFATPYAAYAAFINAPCIITTRGSDMLKVIPDLKNASGLRNRMLFRVFKSAFNKAAAITSTSIRQVENVKKNFPANKNVSLIRTGVDVQKILNLPVEQYLPPQLKNRRFIFSSRYMLPVYNHETQVAAIRLLDKKILDEYLFVFVKGREPYNSKMSREIATVEGLNYVILDYQTQEAAWACFKSAALTFMVPHSDGTPNSALEAMVAGCPLIVGDVGYDEDLFSDTCIIVERTNPRQLADAITSALENYPQHLLENAKERVMRLGNRDIEMNKMLRIYESIAGGRKV